MLQTGWLFFFTYHKKPKKYFKSLFLLWIWKSDTCNEECDFLYPFIFFIFGISVNLWADNRIHIISVKWKDIISE